MKLRAIAFAAAVAALVSLSPAAKADQAVTVGLNGAPFDKVQGANVSWVRTGPYWSTVEPSDNQFVFDPPNDPNTNPVDQNINDARAAGLNVLYVLSGAPQWCGGGTNGATPCDIELWKRFVDRLTAHLGDRVAAYEIWNEPDFTNSSTYGVGWDRNVDFYPRFVDYVVEAARIIKTNCPTCKVVAPAFSGKREDLNKVVRILDQFENTWYSDGTNASYWVDVISGHMDAKEDTHSEDAADLYNSNVLNYIAWYNPSNRNKEQWITEFGWPSSFSEDSQRVRTKNFLIEMTGGGYHWLQGWNFTHGFIYLTQSCDSSDNAYRSIYRCSNGVPTATPKAVTSQYLQPLGWPATQQPGMPRE